jgi:hypothetical protein
MKSKKPAGDSKKVKALRVKKETLRDLEERSRGKSVKGGAYPQTCAFTCAASQCRRAP